MSSILTPGMRVVLTHLRCGTSLGRPAQSQGNTCIFDVSPSRGHMLKTEGVVCMLRSVLAGVTLFALATGPLYAQGSDRPEQGDRVRVTLDEGSGEYLVAELQAESPVLRSDPASATFDVPTATLARLEVYRGSTSRLAGFLAGGLAGGVLGTFVAIPCNAGQGHFTCRGIPAGQRILISAGLGALVGFFAWGARDIWQEVRVPGQLAPATPSRGGRLALGPGASRITREQIASSPNWDAAEIIQRLRPSWLRTRVQATLATAGVTDAALAANGQGSIPDPAIYPEVFEDDLHFGPLNTLRQFPSEEIEAIEFISATAATTRYPLCQRT